MFILYLITLFLVACASNPCDDDVKQRLCQKGDKDCVREFFNKHSCCRPVYEKPSCDEYDMVYVEAPLKHANVTFLCQKSKVRGANDVEIVDMYLNNRNQLILVIEFENLVTYGPAMVARYYITGQAPVELSDYFSITYNPAIQASFKAWTENLLLSVQEASLNKGLFYFDLYFTNNICVF